MLAIFPVGSVSLIQVDGTALQGTAPPDRVKKFFEDWKEREVEEEEEAEEEVQEVETGEEDGVIKETRVMSRREWGFYVQAR